MNSFLLPSISYAKHGFIDLNYYHDSRNFKDMTLNLLAPIDEHFEYFSFTNFSHSVPSTQGHDLATFYSEQNLRWKLGKNSIYKLASQYAISSGQNNDKLRLGVLIQLSSHSAIKKWLTKRLTYSLTLFPLQFDSNSGFNWQLEHFYFLRIWSDRLFLSGFLDHNILTTGQKIVTEHQLAYRIHGHFFIVSEYRVNQFLPVQKQGLAIGLEYKILL